MNCRLKAANFVIQKQEPTLYHEALFRVHGELTHKYLKICSLPTDIEDLFLPEFGGKCFQEVVIVL